MRKEAESLDELVGMLQDSRPSELVVGLPYHIAPNLGNEGGTPPDPVTFSVLAHRFEVDFRRKVLGQEPPRSIAENPEWLGEWNARGEAIVEASEARQMRPPYSE